MRILDNYSLLAHNTFGLDVSCHKFVEYSSLEELDETLAQLRIDSEEPYLHIGEGSNLLFTENYRGTILHSALKGKEVIDEDDEKVLLKVGAGESWDELVAWCVEHGYYGLENLSYIPGEVGAAAVQNIGAYGAEFADYAVAVETMAVADGAVKVFEKDECDYAYRHSVFKTAQRGRFVVTHVILSLSKKFVPDLTYGAISRELEVRGMKPSDVDAQALRDLIIDVRKSKLPEPCEIGSAGSFFMNPVVSKEFAADLLLKYPQMPHYVMNGGVKVPAGWLIEQCGWKGKSLGNAGVYSKQALVLVNLGGATGEDIVRLSQAVQQDVLKEFGIQISPEVNFI